MKREKKIINIDERKKFFYTFGRLKAMTIVKAENIDKIFKDREE